MTSPNVVISFVDFPFKIKIKSFVLQNDGTLSTPGTSGGDPAADYSSGANHVLAVIHQILGHHRALEARYHQARLKLHQRLALLLYKEDCRQVC